MKLNSVSLSPSPDPSRFMDNEIPHINPGDPKIVRRYYDYDEKRKP